MNQKELSELTDQELIAETKKMKSNALINATFIGFLIGIIIYSVVKNNLGFLTLIPLFLVFKLLKNAKHSKNSKDLEDILKERNLK